MTYNKLYDIVEALMQEFNTSDSSTEETETGVWSFIAQDTTGQLVISQNESDDTLSLFLHFYLMPLPTVNREAFYDELLRYNTVSPFAKYGVHEDYAVLSIAFQDFTMFTKEFFALVFRRYLVFVQETRADMGTRYFDYNSANSNAPFGGDGLGEEEEERRPPREER